MDSAKEAELEASQVISPSLLANLRQPPIGWLCPPQKISSSVRAMTGKDRLLQPTMARRYECEEENFEAESQQFIFACEDVERGTGEQTDWAGNVWAEWARQRSAKGLVDHCLAHSAQTIFRPASLCSSFLRYTYLSVYVVVTVIYSATEQKTGFW